MVDGSPIINLVNYLLIQAIRAKAAIFTSSRAGSFP